MDTGVHVHATAMDAAWSFCENVVMSWNRCQPNSRNDKSTVQKKSKKVYFGNQQQHQEKRQQKIQEIIRKNHNVRIRTTRCYSRAKTFLVYEIKFTQQSFAMILLTLPHFSWIRGGINFTPKSIWRRIYSCDGLCRKHKFYCIFEPSLIHSKMISFLFSRIFPKSGLWK